MNTKLNRASLIVETYMQALERKGYASQSIRTYRLYTNAFFKYLLESEKLDDLKQVDRQVISRYQSYLYSEERGLALRSQAHQLVALRTFFKWLEREGVFFYDPTSQIELPKKPETLPRDIFTEEEIRGLLNAVEIDSKLGLRDKAILELLYSTGIRSGELSNLTLYDLNKDAGMLHIRGGKAMKDRVIPVGAVALGYVEEYIDHGRKRFLRSEKLPWLFVSLRGTKLKPENVPDIVQKYAAIAGIKRYVCAHMIRHSVATHMLRHDAPIRVIQEMLGHKKLETTQIYTRVEIKDLKKIHEKTHPRELGI